MSFMNSGTRIEITTSTIIKAILLVFCAIVLFALSDVVLVVLTAVVIASSLEPMIKWFMGMGMYRSFSAIITYALIGGILLGLFYTFVPRLLQDTSEFLNSVPEYLTSSSLWDPLDVVEDVSPAPDTIAVLGEGTMDATRVVEVADEGSIRGAIQSINEAITAVSAGFVHSTSSIFGGVLSLVFIAVLSFYFAVQEDGIEKFLRIVVPARQEGYVVGLWKRTQAKIGLWMQGQLILAVVVGTLVYFTLTALGVRNALVFAVLAGLLEMIPLFGPIIAAIPAVATSFVDTGATSALIVGAMYIVIQQFENHLIYPLVVKKIVGVPPILVILALLVGFKLGGFLGIIISVPLASMLVEFLDDVQKDKQAHV